MLRRAVVTGVAVVLVVVVVGLVVLRPENWVAVVQAAAVFVGFVLVVVGVLRETRRRR